MLAAAGIALSATGPASGFVSPEPDRMIDVPLPAAHSPYVHPRALTETVALEIEAAFARVNGGRWQAFGVDAHTWTPSYLVGSGVETGLPLANDRDAESSARSIIAAHPEVFGAEAAELTLRDVRRALGAVAVHVVQTHHGIPVWGASAHLTFTESGRLFAMGSRIYDDVDVSVDPWLSAPEAERVARDALPFDPSTDVVERGTTLGILPVPAGPSDVDHHLVWRSRIHTADPRGIWVTHVDAHSGEIVWCFNDVHFLEFSGSAESDVADVTYCDGSTPQASAYLDLNVAGIGTVTTDGEGLWNAGEGGEDTRPVTSHLSGPYGAVYNAGGPDAVFSGSATAGTPFAVVWDDTNSQPDERDVFDAINDVHDFFETFDPGYVYSNDPIDAYVSIDNTCNAFWDGSINFYLAGDGCANTGEIQGVVQHEFGHGVQNNLLGEQGNEGLGEGNSDVLANLMTQESIVGRGFFEGDCAGGLRNSNNTLQYPDDVVGQNDHDAGRVIAGFSWDMMVGFQALHGVEQGALETARRWHFARKLETPTFQPAQVIATFIADDLPANGGDGNLDNGTPHFDAICAAATNHGFTCPEISAGVFISHAPVVSRDVESDVAFVATVVSTEGPIDPETVQLTYRRNDGPPIDVGLLPTGNPDEYAVTIPGEELPIPSEVRYSFTAEDVTGTRGTLPRTSEAALEFDVAAVWEPFESGDGEWIVNADGADDATTGLWEYGDPNETMLDGVVQPGDDHSEPGSFCWVTGNAAGSAGADDVDGGRTTLQTPGYDVSGSSLILIKYWRYYTNSLGAEPNNDEWVVQVRNDGGPWVDVERTQDDQNRWYQHVFDAFAVFGAAAGNLEVRFVASDEQGASLVEALVDDFAILADLGTIVNVEIGPAPGGVPGAAYLGGASPNPFNPRTTIRYGLSTSSAVRLEVFDATGRSIRTLVNTTQTAGHHAIVWDGRDDVGRNVASGRYYGRLTTGDETRSTTLTLLR